MRLVLDWHNYGYSIMQVNRVNWFLVKIAKFYEMWLGKKADLHLCVSKAMQLDLEEYGINAHVMYDRATDKFKWVDINWRAEIYKKYVGENFV